MTAEPAAVELPVVLVTRPEGAAADALCRSVVAAGFPVIAQPLMEIEPVVPLEPAQRQRVLDLDLYQHVIFVSANAVRAGMDLVETYWPQLPDGIQWYAVGGATAAALADHGVSALTPGEQMHSEGLLALPALAAVNAQRVLIIKGEGGRDTIRRTLEGRGARVDELACYHRRCPTFAPGVLARILAQSAVGVVLISSGEGLCNFVELLRPAEPTNFSALRLIVPSERVAALARAAGFERILTAGNASDAAMLRALENCKTCHGG